MLKWTLKEGETFNLAEPSTVTVVKITGAGVHLEIERMDPLDEKLQAKERRKLTQEKNNGR